MKLTRTPFLLALLAAVVLAGSALCAKPHAPGRFTSMFWLWQDKQIEDRAAMMAELQDLKAAGFNGLYAMPRATRYDIYDREMIDAVKAASEACRKEGIEFIRGPDPRFAANRVTRETGYGAEYLIVTEEFNKKPKEGEGRESKAVLNEAKVEGGRYSLRFGYPSKRDVHMLTQVGLWLNPVGVDKVIAYQWKDGRVDAASLRDITPTHHLFINRSQYYIEVFGSVELPAGDWRVVAFPRFMSNMYAFDSPEHEERVISLLDTYKKEGVHFDGLWWDEPGYYVVFGQYPISERIYKGFREKYGYDLREKLGALLLPLSDNTHLKVRHDYFQLIMDYVFGAEKRFWAEGEKRFGKLRMGIHQYWHTIPDDMYHGSADRWRGVESVDGGYTDDGGFEQYFKRGTGEKFGQIAYMIMASSLAKFSRSGQAFYNRWGVNYEAEVPKYWNDLMTLFSNQWIQHAYGYTGVIGASRNFGPGFPDHSTWSLLPALNERTRKVYDVTHCKLPVAEVAFVYPMVQFLVSREPENEILVNKLDRLLGAMPAAGVQADAISDGFLSEGRLENGQLLIRGQRYKALVVPCAKVVSKETLAVIRTLLAAKFPVVFADEVPSLTLDGSSVQLDARVGLQIGNDAAAESLPERIEALGLPSPATRLKGGYVTVLPGEGDTLYAMVMPIVPGSTISGDFVCAGQRVTVKPTRELAVYRIAAGKVSTVTP